MAFPPSHTSMFHTTTPEDHDHLHSTFLNSFASFTPQHFQGGAPFMMKRSKPFSGIDNNKCDQVVHRDDELSDDGLQVGEKKKRLNLEQVKALEKSFESGNKLEPERKMHLAKVLGLQPRQIAIWFQNRRARWKTKQLEKEYEVLKKQFEELKADNDALKAQNQTLHAELQALRSRDCCEAGTTISHMKETEGSWSNGSDNRTDISLDLSRIPVINSPVSSQNCKSLSLKPTSITQLLQYSSRSDIQDESFCKMFHNIDEQHNFCPWPEQHHFH